MARTSMCREARWPATHRIATPRPVSWSTSPATMPSATFADGNNEWPAVPSVVVRNTALESLGKFKQDTLPISDIGRAQVNAARIIDRAGWR
jgi:hypothetical protein